ncbi:MAG: hypothetical protein QNK27_09125 [Desulfuromusa sp.]|nr:hypothetical protein [Desulfuromusa sp.]
MFRKQWQTFNEGDIFWGDKGFFRGFDIAELEKRKVDSVVTIARRTRYCQVMSKETRVE